MRIVMTGATGKLGNLIARQLLCRLPPEELIVSVRRPDAAADLAGKLDMMNAIELQSSPC